MKISQKLVRRIFLLLFPILLATTMVQCRLLDELFFILCKIDPPVGFSQNDFGNQLFPPGNIIYVGDGGEIYIGEGVYNCEYDTELIIVPGEPNLNAITRSGFEGVGNIIFGDNGTIVQLDSLEINFIPNPAGTPDMIAIWEDSRDGYITAVGDNGTIILSTDFGLTWSEVNFPFMTNLKSVFTLWELTNENSRITVTGENYSAYKSFDGGDTWEQIVIGVNKRSFGPTSINVIFFYDENVGYMGGPFGLMGKTTDGGANWVFFPAPDFEEINDLYFISPDSGVAVGSPGIVRFTTDGGDTWEEDLDVTNLLGGKTIKKIGVLDEVSGRVIGEDGLNIIFTTDSTLLTAINEDGIHIHNFSLSNNYPNPFNPSTIIEYSLPQLGFVTLTVYDMLGREIVTLVNEEKPIGSYEVEFDAIGLTSGIYFYRLQAGNFIQTQKMILIK